MGLSLEKSKTLINSTEKSDKRHVLPLLTLKLGEKYEGQWKNCKRDGFGTQIWPNGDYYEGEWINDKIQGRGKLTHINGDFYDGEFENNEANGYGCYSQANGAHYEGEWKNNKKYGKGNEIYSESNRSFHFILFLTIY